MEPPAKRPRAERNEHRTWLLTMPVGENWENCENPEVDCTDKDVYGPLTFDHATGDVLYNTVITEKERITFMAGQMEEGDGGYWHYHVVVRFTYQKSMAAVKRVFECDCINVVPVVKDNGVLDYIHKDDSFTGMFRFSWGQKSSIGQGHRSDVSNSTDLLMSSGDLGLVASSFPDTFIKFHGGLKSLLLYTKPPGERDDPIIFWYYGPTGSGKSTTALLKIKELEVTYGPAYHHSPDLGTWFDGYTNQRIIYFDDFNDYDDERKSCRDVEPFLRLLSKNPYARQIKGGTVPIRANVFVFSCKKKPGNCFTLSENQRYKDWCRRFFTCNTQEKLTVQECNYNGNDFDISNLEFMGGL